MTDTPPKTMKVAVLDNPHAPEILVDEVVGFFMHNQRISLTLASDRADHTQDPAGINRVVMARLALPIPVAQMLVLGLNDYLAKNGLDPSSAVKGNDTAQ